MAYGVGSFYQDDRRYWVAVVNLPPGPDGKRRRNTIRRRAEKAVVDERLRSLGEHTTTET